MRGILLVAEREVRERLKSRSLRVSTFIAVAAIVAMIAIPAARGSHARTYIVGVAGKDSPALRSAIEGTGRVVGATVVVVPLDGEVDGEHALRDSPVDLVLVDEARFVVRKTPDPASGRGRLLIAVSETVRLQSSLERSGIGPDAAAAVLRSPPLPVRALEHRTVDETTRMTVLYGVILLFVLLQQYGAWILTGVIEEKTSRVVEVLLATMRPRQLLAGKVLGIGVVALGQAVLFAVASFTASAVTGANVLHGARATAVLAVVIWFVLGYAFYCSLYGAAGSLATRLADVQNVSFPIQIPLLVAYFLSFGALFSGEAPAYLHVMAFFPPTAPISMLVLIGIGKVAAWEVALSAACTVAATVLLLRVSGSIYERAILHAGSRLRWRDLGRRGGEAATRV